MARVLGPRRTCVFPEAGVLCLILLQAGGALSQRHDGLLAGHRTVGANFAEQVAIPLESLVKNSRPNRCGNPAYAYRRSGKLDRRWPLSVILRCDLAVARVVPQSGFTKRDLLP